MAGLWSHWRAVQFFEHRARDDADYGKVCDAVYWLKSKSTRLCFQLHERGQFSTDSEKNLGIAYGQLMHGSIGDSMINENFNNELRDMMLRNARHNNATRS